MPPTSIIAFAGTCAPFNFANVLWNGNFPSAAREYATREPESINPLQLPNTETMIPIDTICPPSFPKIFTATADAGAVSVASSDAGSTHRYARLNKLP